MPGYLSRSAYSLKLMGQKLWAQAAPVCARCDAVELRSKWHRMHRRSNGTQLHGLRYCGTECLQVAILESLVQSRPALRRDATSHRIPLGLILVSRQQLSIEQLREALAAQRDAGQGRIGEWLQELGFASELNITSALARQWSCPMLRNETALTAADCCPQIPLSLLECFQMMPVAFVEASRTLLIAFCNGIDYTALYAIENVLGYHTQACLVGAKVLQVGLQALGRRRIADDVRFDRVEDDNECARIVGSYAAKVAAKELRMARCGAYLWVRLQPSERSGMNLVLTCRESALGLLFSSVPGPA